MAGFSLAMEGFSNHLYVHNSHWPRLGGENSNVVRVENSNGELLIQYKTS